MECEDSASRGSRLIYVGIDEAGYGPRLGPLCIGASAFEIAEWMPGSAAPDLWKLLRGAVCRDAKEAKSGRLPVNDSKKLKLHHSDPAAALTHLERGVLAFVSAVTDGSCPESESALFSALAAGTNSGLPWYEGDGPLPRSTTADHLRVLSSQLAGTCAASGVRVLGVRGVIFDEARFNAGIAAMGNKGRVSFEAVAAMLRWAWERFAPMEGQPRGGVRVVIDRQGGRTHYAESIERAVPGCVVTMLEETDRASRYEVRSADEGDDRCMTLLFKVEAEAGHLPVALASMTAKLCRELLMGRFNRYWCGRFAELKPTAGYALDAGRWLREMRPKLDRSDLDVLVRRA